MPLNPLEPRESAIFMNFLEPEMLKDLFDFSKKRSGKEAVIFYLFYIGCFALLTLALNGQA